MITNTTCTCGHEKEFHDQVMGHCMNPLCSCKEFSKAIEWLAETKLEFIEKGLTAVSAIAKSLEPSDREEAQHKKQITQSIDIAKKAVKNLQHKMERAQK